MNKDLKIAVFSDIHLGNKRTKSESIIKGFYKALPDNQETADLDIVFLAGDVFDRLLEYPSEDVSEISQWIHYVLRICSKHNIMLRVLEGTPSHDWGQSENFNITCQISGLPVDLKYVKTLSIEYIEKHDIHVLYVPDEWEVTTEKTLSQVKDLMKAKSLDKVDFAIMHGNFEFQLPAHIKKIPRHDSAEYLALVSEYIFIGHIHNFSFLDRIIAQGSFDRLAHNEEEPKGHVRAVIKENGDKEFFFIENKLAKIYKTVKCFGLTIDETIRIINKQVAKLPDGSNIRVEAESDHPIFSNMNKLISMYPTLSWSTLPRSEEKEEIVHNEEVEEYNPITISKDNIVNLMMDRIMNKSLDTKIINRSINLLKDSI